MGNFHEIFAYKSWQFTPLTTANEDIFVQSRREGVGLVNQKRLRPICDQNLGQFGFYDVHNTLFSFILINYDLYTFLDEGDAISRLVPGNCNQIWHCSLADDRIYVFSIKINIFILKMLWAVLAKI